MDQKEKEQERRDELARQMFESDIDFRNQFDPNNPNHHKGNTQPVPVHQQKRIPASMPTEYQESTEPTINSYTTDEEYLQVMEMRNKFTEMKKIMPRLCSPIEMMLRLQSNAKPDESSQ